MKLLLLFPYFIFWSAVLLVAGLLVLWLERKISAKLQWRVGPPWWQSFADMIKLSGKEILIPGNADRFVFMLSPLIGLLGALTAGVLIIFGLFYGSVFQGDLILALYLLTVPSLALIMGGSSSGNVLASVGISREIKLVLSYELPFVAAVVLVIFRSGFSTSISRIVQHQQETGINFFSISGAIAFFVALFALVGKLGIAPFDLAEAETELAGGALIEYSGLLLAMFKMTRAVLYIVGPLFLIACFFGGAAGWIGIFKYLVIFILLVLIKNTNPRMRIDQTLRFYWGLMTLLVFFSFVCLGLK